jgi:MoxR-like ATPase
LKTRPKEIHVTSTDLTTTKLTEACHGQAAGKLRALRDELIELFPEREQVITQCIFALLTREHVLITGVYGTGKTDLVQMVFRAILGANIFSASLTKFASESLIFGVPNVKTLREEGKVRHDRTEGIFDAHFAELDELLDAQPALLRVLLGVLNERVFKRGKQLERVSLRTAIASTNGDPALAAKQSPELGAVLDRFLFRGTVAYLEGEEARRAMYTKYLERRECRASLSLTDLDALSEIVVNDNLIMDPEFLTTYDEAIQAWRKVLKNQSLPALSDRTACKILQVVEAEAVLNGRRLVELEDILAIRWALCRAGVPSDYEQFDKAVRPIINKALASVEPAADSAERKLIERLGAEFRAAKADRNCDAGELVTVRRELLSLLEELGSVVGKLASTRDMQAKLRKQITARLAANSAAIDTVGASTATGK